MKAKYIIGLVIILVFAGWGITAFIETAVRYVPYDRAKVSERQVQVVGGIDFKSVVYDTEHGRMTFSIYEIDIPDEKIPDTLAIIYYGVVPGNFDQATSVMIRGKAAAEGFVAEQLLVKCPSKYQGMAPGESAGI